MAWMTSKSIDRQGASPGAALVAAVTASFTFEIAVLAPLGPLPPLRYLVLCLAATMLATLLVWMPVARSRGPGAVVGALAVWAGLQAAVFFAGGRGLLVGLAFAAVTAGGLAAARRAGVSPWGLGVAVGGAVCLDLIIFPKVLFLLAAWFPPGVARDVLRVLVLAVILFTFSEYAALRVRRPRWPREIVVTVAVLAVVVLVTPFTYRARPWGMESGDLGGPAEPPAAAAARNEAGPPILLIVLDTVRADQLSIYGYERDTTPRLSQWLEKRPRAVLFPLAFSTATWTLPAHASLLTGTVPTAHGAHGGNVRYPGRSTPSVPRLEAEVTLAEHLRANGYRTAVISANVQLGATPGMERGFDVFWEPPSPRPLFLIGEKLRARFVPWLLADTVKPYPAAPVVNREVLRFVDGAAPSGWFVLANYMEAHAPYAASSPHAGAFSQGMSGAPPVTVDARDPAERLAHARSRYDEEILALDAAIGDLLDELERRELLDRMWVVITADHGEAFGEHGAVAHGTSIYNEEVRIPLIVMPPAGEELPRREEAVGLLDVTATLSAIGGGKSLGIGRDLREEVSGPGTVPIEFFGTPRPTDPGFFDRAGELARIPARAVVADRWKLVDYPDRRELFSMADDLEERRDRAADFADEAESLARYLPPLGDPTRPPPARRPLTAEEADRLRALGYLE
jgi:arylsulfatase A-like enzyme